MSKVIQSCQHHFLKTKKKKEGGRGGFSNCEESNMPKCHECQARELPGRKMKFNETILRHKVISFSDAFCDKETNTTTGQANMITYC